MAPLHVAAAGFSRARRRRSTCSWRCSIRRRRPAASTCRGATAGLPRPKNHPPAGSRRGLGRARLLQRHKAAGARAKRHQPGPRTLAAAAAAGRRQRRPRAAPRPRALHMPATTMDARQVMVRPIVRGGRGDPHLGSSIIRRAGAGRNFHPGTCHRWTRGTRQTCCAARPKARGEACEVRWRGAHQALAQTSSVAARPPGVLGRLRPSWRRSAARCWRT